MTKLPLFTALALALSLVPARSQSSAPKGEADLLKKMDEINLNSGLAKPTDAVDILPGTKKDKSQGQTEITADAAEFNNKTHIAIFIGNVIVKNPEFNCVCDKLTAYLKNDDKPKVAPVASTDAAAPKPKGGGLEKAIAEMVNGGKVVITQDKPETDGTTSHSIGKGTRAEYEATTGNVRLFGWPEAKQGASSGVAVEESAVMIMTRDGHMRTERGRVKFIIQDNGK